MLSILNKIWFLYASVSLFVFGRGITVSYVPIRANIEGISITTIGILQALGFFGIALGGMYVIKMIRKVGYVRTFGVCAALVSVAPLIQAINVNVYLWACAQIMLGYGTAGVYTVIEAWLNHATPNEHRGKVFSFYSLTIVAVYALSPLLINMVDQTLNTLFLITSIFVSLAFLPVALVVRESPEHEYSESIKLKTLYRRTPYGVKGMLLSMFSIGIFYSVFVVYIVNMDFDVKYAMLCVFMFGFGAVLSTYPMGLISDSMDRRIVILSILVLSVFACAGVIYASIVKQIPILLLSVFALGAFMSPLHPLTTSHINDRLKQHEMSSVAAWLILGGALAGGCASLITGILMDIFGVFILPWFLMGMLFINALICVHAIKVRGRVSEKWRGDFVNLTTMSTTALRQGVYDTDESLSESSHVSKQDED